MGLSGRELLLVVRASDEASGTIRKIGGSIAGLGRASAAASKMDNLKLRQMQLMAQRARTLEEIQRTTGGPAALNLAKQRNALQAQQIANTGKLNDAMRQHRALSRAISASDIASQKNLNDLYRAETALRKKNAQIARGGPAANLSNLRRDAQALTARIAELNAAEGVAAQRAATLRERQSALSRVFQQHGTAVRNVAENSRLLDARQAQLAARAGHLSSKLKIIDAQLVDNARNMRLVNQEMRRDSFRRLGAASQTVGHMGRSVRTFGIVAAAGFGLAAKAYADFSEKVSLAATQTGPAIGRQSKLITDNAKKIENGILDLMKSFPASSDEMTAAAFDIFSSTDIQKVSKGISLLKTFNKAAVAGMTPLEDVTHAGISVMNAFKLQASDMPQIMARMFAGVRFGRMTFAEFTQSLNQLVPAFAGAGQSFDTMTGSLAFLTRVMPSVRMSATSLARLTEVMSRKDFVEGTKKAGVSITDFQGRLLPLPKIIESLGKRFPTLRKGGTDLNQFFKQITALGKAGDIDHFAGSLKQLRALGLKGGLEGTVFARRAFQHMLLNYELLSSIIDRVTKDNQEFSQSYAAQARTLGNQWKVFTNGIKADFLAIGRDSIPGLIKAFGPIQKLIDMWRDLSPETRKHITAMAVWVAGAAIVAGTVASLVSGFVRLIAMFGAMGKLGPLGITILAGLAIALSKGALGFDDMADAGNRLLDVLKKMGGNFLTFAGGSVPNFAIAVTAGAIALNKFARGAKMAGAAAKASKLAQLANVAFIGSAAAQAVPPSAPKEPRITSTRNFGAVTKEAAAAERSAGRMARGMQLAGAAALAMPPQLKIILGLVGAIGVGAYLWKRHMEGVQAHAEAIAHMGKELNAVTQGPLNAARSFSTLGDAVSAIGRGKNNLVILNDEIKKTKAELAKAPPDQRKVIEAQLNNLLQDRRDLLMGIEKATLASNNRFNQMSNYIRKQNGALTVLGQQHYQLFQLTKQRAQLERSVADAERQHKGVAILPSGQTVMLKTAQGMVESLTGRIQTLREHMRGLAGASTNAAKILRAGFTSTIRDFERQGLLKFKFKIPRTAIDDALQTAMQTKGRMFTLRELDIFFRARLDPKSLPNLSKIPKDLRDIVIHARLQFGAEQAAKSISAVMNKAMGDIQVSNMSGTADMIAKKIGEVKTKVKLIDDAEAAKKRISAPFATNIEQLVKVTDNNAGQALWGTLYGIFSQTITQTIQINKITSDTTYLKTIPIFGGKGPAAAGGDTTAVATADTMINSVTTAIDEGAPQLTTAFTDTIDTAMISFKPKPTVAGQVTTKLINAFVKALARKDTTPIQKQFALTMDNLFNGPWLSSDAFQKKLDGIESPLKLDLFGSKFLEAREQGIQDFKDRLKQWKKTIYDAKHELAKDTGDWTREHNQRLRKIREAQQEVGKATTDASRAARERTVVSKQRALRDWLEDHPQPKLPRMPDRPKVVKELTARDIAKDFQNSSRVMVQFVNNLDRVRRRGVPKAMLDELAELGIEGADKLALLAHGSQKYINQSVRAWERGRAAAEKLAVAAKKVSAPDILKDMKAQAQQMLQFNAAIARIKFRGAPAGFIQELRSMGVEQLQFILSIARSNPKLFKAIIAEWKKMQKAVKNSQYQNLEDTKEWTKDYKSNLKTHKDELKAGFKSIISEMYEFQKQAFGTLFSGLEDAISARQSLHDTVMGFFGDVFEGLDDLLSKNAQAIDDASSASTDATDKAASDAREAYDKLKSAFGELFSGSWLSGEEVSTRLEWGQILKMDDLQKDLQSQVDAFQSWRSNLRSLTARGLPADMLKELEDLGIGAADKIAVLNNATDFELTSYVNLWKTAQKSIGDKPAEAIDKLANTISTVLVPTIKDLSDVLSMNVDNLVQWSTDINSLIGKGLPEALIQQLIEMGPQAGKAIHALAGATDEELKNYIALWQKGRTALESVANRFIRGTTPEEVLANLRAQVKGFEDWNGTLNDLAKKKVPLEVIKSLRELGPEAEPFLKVLLSMTDSELNEWIGLWSKSQEDIKKATEDQFQEQLDMWRKHGSNIALQLIAGVMDEQDLLLAFFTDLFKTLLDPNTPANNKKLPRHFLDTLPMDTNTLSNGTTNSIINGNGGNTYVQMDVTAYEDESLSSTLERSRFRMENRV